MKLTRYYVFDKVNACFEYAKISHDSHINSRYNGVDYRCLAWSLTDYLLIGVF